MEEDWLPMSELEDPRLLFEDESGRETPGTAPATPDARRNSDAADTPTFDEMRDPIEPPDDDEPER